LAPNKRKILEAARKYAQKGAKDRALKEYEKLLKLDPRDAKLRLEIGDAYRRWGQVEEAIAAYTKVAEQYMDEGFDARAVAVFKQIQNLDPQFHAAYVQLAELYQRMGLTSEAIQALQTAADGYHREGKKHEALDLLRKMATLDPSNTTSRIKVADLLRQENLSEEAIAEYQAAYEELARQGESEAAGNVLERILEVEPTRVATLSALADNLLKRGFAERAEPFAKRALQNEPDEVAHYELLADVYGAQQRDAELADTYRNLADLYRRRGDEDSARDIIQRFVPPDGLAASLDADAVLGDESLVGDEPLVGEASLMGGGSALGHGSALGDESILGDESARGEGSILGDEPALSEDGPTLIEEELLENEILDENAADEPVVLEDFAEKTVIEFPETSAALPATDEIPIPRQLDQEIEPPAPEIAGDPEQLLAEASVYLRYGKRAQAVENLEAILAADPEQRQALEKLGEAHADAGDSAAAVAAWLRAAESARGAGDEEGLVVLRDRIAALDAEAAASLGIGAAKPEEEVEEILDFSDGGEEFVLEAPAAALEEGSTDEPEIEFEDEIEIDVGEIDAGGTEGDELAGSGASRSATKTEEGAPTVEVVEAAGSSFSELSVSASASQQVTEDLEEAEFYRQQGLLDEAAAIYERVLQVAPNHPLAQVRMGEIAAERGEDPGSTGTGLTLPPEPQKEGQEPAPVDEIGHDLAEWSDAGLSDGEIDVEQAGDGEFAETPGAELSRELGASAESDLALAEGADDMALEADAAQGVEIEIPIDDETDSSLLTEDTTGEPIAVDVLPDESESTADAALATDDGVAAAAEEEMVLHEAEDDDTDVSVAVDPSISAAAEEEMVLDEAEEDDTDVSVTVDEGVAAAAEEEMVLDGDGDDTEDAPAVDEGLAASFDLAAELSEALDADEGSSSGNVGAGAEADGFAAVFREFKKGVSKTLSEADHEAHYDLGIAYREMGLLDDAIGEFQLAMGSANRRVDSLHMLGICSHELDRAEEAVVHLQTALEAAEVTDAQVMAIRFELGLALESIGEIDRARETWQLVAAVDPSFCEVEQRLAALEEAKPEPEPEPDPGFESFGDLFEAEEESPEAVEGTASAAGEAPESFEDLIAEANEDRDDDSGLAAAGATAPAQPVPEAPEEPEVPQPQPDPPKKRRKKKISFV
jgi:tetratricopeptide (TPR) repeat protein